MLLEGRIGMVCELSNGFGSENGATNEVYLETVANTLICTTEAPVQSFDTIEVQSGSQSMILRGTDNERLDDQNLINHTWNLSLQGPSAMPYTCTPSQKVMYTFYRHLCSGHDPPRSIAICPQQRSVAFGCSAGIALHWTDAAAKQSLSRWFPLTSPSDYLYIFSPRAGCEESKKLCLISSARHGWDENAGSSRSNSFESDSDSPCPQPPTSDFYHAVPLSDGHHFLFIQPSTRKLAMGCYTAQRGASELLLRVVFVPPENIPTPSIYTAAADMSQDVVVVAAYGETIVLYSIPSEVCRASQPSQDTEKEDFATGLRSSVEERRRNHWRDWWDEPSATEPSATEPSAQRARDNNSDIHSPSWPIAIRGTKIGTFRNTCELAVQTQPDIHIWAFSHSAQCLTWRLRNHADPAPRTRYFVCASGLMHEAFSVDETSDVIMRDEIAQGNSMTDLCGGGNRCGLASAKKAGVAELDVVESGFVERFPKALALENDARVDLLDVRAFADAWFEADGDVLGLHRTEANNRPYSAL